MAKLQIEYLVPQRRASLSIDKPSRAWAYVKRACEETSDEVESPTLTTITLPWWAFLGCRKAIEFYCRRYDVALTYAAQAAAEIRRADKHRQAYEKARTTTPLKPAAVVARLRKLEFVRELTPEQIRNVSKIASLPAAATFSVPGAGKTTEALAYFALRGNTNSRLLVIAPKNAFAAWEEQLRECMPNATDEFVRLRGGVHNIENLLRARPRLMLVTYQQLPNATDLIADFLTQYPTFVFLDESHRIKRGLSGVIGNSILSLSDAPVAKLIMTGTPLPNEISDLVPQFKFLYPEVDVEAQNVTDLIKPIYVRTVKRELRIPAIHHALIEVPLRPAQRQLYELLRSEAAREANTNLRVQDKIRLRSIGRSALRLIQLVSNPALLARVEFAFPDLLSSVLEEGDSSKLEYACLRARQLAARGQKSIIWSAFIENVELLANRLADIGADYIHGGVDAGSDEEDDTREGKIRRFHEAPDAMVLVANPAACGEGISLHRICHHAIYLDRNYNAAQYLQSEDRIHRLGLPKGQITYVELLVSPDTVDESVHHRLRTKINLMADVLDDPGLRVDPIALDPDEDTFDLDDLHDFLRHLRATS